MSGIQKLSSYKVWDVPTRLFHWVNVITILGLVAFGTAILNAGNLGASDEGKILLKEIHVWIGYVFAVNLLIRLFGAFVGGSHARWRAFLPIGKGYGASLREYVQGFMRGKAPIYLGHNPLGRISVTLLLLLLVTQAVTGLILAGTDIFYPPFGAWVAEWIAADGVDPATLMPYAKETYDPTAYAEMRDLRSPIIDTHYYTFFAILMIGLLHIVAVVWTEIREGGGLISAMITGRKTLSDEPVDSDT